MDRSLRGLPGLNTISDAERQQFMLDNGDKLKKYKTANQRKQAAEILYNNIQFRKTFGDDAFERAKASGYDLEARNRLLENKVIGDRAKEVFGKDADFNALSSQLDTQGWKDLFESEYLGTEERKKRLASGIEASKKVGKSYDTAINNPYVDALGAGFMQVGKASASLSPYQQDEDYAKKDKEIKEKLFAETQARREMGIQGISDDLYSSMLDADSRGEKSLADFYKNFDALAGGKDADGVPYSPHYMTFKNSKWLKDYTNEDKLKDYAKYQALKSQYGESIARQYLDRSIQNRVAKAQDGVITGNTLKKVVTTMASDLGSNIALFSNLGRTPEEIGIRNEGKDPNKPIFDKNGKIVDYEKSDDIWTNPAYWNNVYKYNTFSPTEIKAIEERGGISEDVNVKEYGYSPDFLSWETAQEGFSQVGHIAAFGVESFLTGGFGKAVGTAGKFALKGLGLGAKGLAKASKVGNITNDLFVTFAGGASGAQLEAMGTFEEQMQAAKEGIEEQKRKELRDYYNSIDYDTPEAKEAIQSYYDKLKLEDKRRVATTKDEGVTAFPKSDKLLQQEAKQLYTNQLLGAKQQELEELHKGDLAEARKAATKAYGVNFFMDWIKEALFDLALRKFQYAKGSRTGAFDNSLDKYIGADAATGGVKKAKSFLSAKNVSKEIGKQFGGGFTDEYLDGLNASFAKGVGNNDFNNYINKTYNPELYNAATEGMLGNLVAGLSSEIDGITDENNLYEGFIGAVAPGASVMVNTNTVLSLKPKDTWRAIISGTDERGDKISFAERLSEVITNPLLGTYADLVRQERTLDNSVETVNQIIANNKEKLEDASKVLSALNDYSSPIRKLNFVNEDKEDNETSLPSLLDSQDQKLYNAFTLMDILSTLENTQGGEKSALYTEAINTIQGLANDTLSEEQQAEEIDKFLADADNNSVMDNPQNREIAAERLQKNAQYLLETKQKMEDIREIFNNSPSMKNVDSRVKTLLTYNLVAKDDYKKRLESLEEELGSSSKTNPDAMYTPDYSARYGTAKSAEKAVAARERVLLQIQKEKDDVNAQIKEAEEKNQKELVKSLQFQLASIKEREQNTKEEKWDIEELISKTTEGNEDSKSKGNLETIQFTEEYILGLDARDKAKVLNPANFGNYTKKQQKVIEHVRKKLMQQDPTALQKVLDAGILANRISDLNNVQDKLMQNSELAATYLNSVEQQRTNTALAESLQEGIDQHYGKIEKAYNNLYGKRPRNVEKRQQEFKSAVLATNSAVLNAYMEDHLEQADKIQPLYNLMKLDEDAAAVIQEMEAPNEVKLSLLHTLFDMNSKANNREEAISYLEGIVDSPDVPEEMKTQVDNLLSSLNQIGYQRDATVIENRKQRKEREEAEAQRKKKTEEEAQTVAAEAQVKAEEIAKAQQNKEVKADGSNLVDADVIPIGNPNNAELNEESVEDVQLEEESNKTEEKPVNNSVESSPVIDNGDVVQGKSASIDEQILESSDNKEVVISEDNTDVDVINGVGEHNIESNVMTLSGNAMSEWESEALKKDGKLEHKKGKDKNDSMNHFYEWLNNRGIKLQNIIDRELGLILKSNPHAPVRFVGVKPESGVSQDTNISKHLFLVLDYDNSINKNITNIHNEDNGGVIKIKGKKYLIIGVAGYGNINSTDPVIKRANKDKQYLYDTIYGRNSAHLGLLRKGSAAYFNANPLEEFRLLEGVSTEIVPMSLIPGYIVNQLEKDESKEFRSINEILSDSERNPQGLKLEDLAFGIQELTKFLVVGADINDIMVPRNTIRNSGSAFVLIPASNGKMVPSYLKPLFYNEMKEGQLKDNIEDLLNRLVAPSYDTRYQALMDLTRIFHLSDEGENILLGKDGTSRVNQITLKRGDTTIASITLDDSFDLQSFLKSFSDLNPRINITKNVIQNSELLQQYDEAGALQTDIALLNTAGASYSIYGVDNQGNMLQSSTTDNVIKVSKDDDFRNGDKRQVVFKGAFYTYSINEDRYYLNGTPILDENLIKNLNYNRRVIEAGISPIESKGNWSTYILGNKENPEAVKIHRNTKEVIEIPDSEAVEIIERIEKETAQKERAKAAKNALENSALQEVSILEEDNNDLIVDETTGDFLFPTTVSDEVVESEEKEKKGGETSTKESNSQNNNISSSEVQLQGSSNGNTQTFYNLAKSKKWRKQISNTIRTKWPDAPTDRKGLDDFLRKKDIEIDAIGTSDAAVKAWIDTIINCR